MYVTQLHVYPADPYPLLNGNIYDRIATEQHLPSIELMLKSLDEDVAWPDVPGLECYYLDNLREADPGHKFMLRWHANTSARDKTTLHIRINGGVVNGMSFLFPARGDRMISSQILAIIKSACENVRAEADIQVQGFYEDRGFDRATCNERRLSGFVWVPGLDRYLHVKENPRQIKEVMKGYIDLT